jgi:hypothetical protein
VSARASCEDFPRTLENPTLSGALPHLGVPCAKDSTIGRQDLYVSNGKALLFIDYVDPRSLGFACPTLTPLIQKHYHGVHVEAFLSQAIFDRPSITSNLAPVQQIRLDKLTQSITQDVPCYSEMLKEIIESSNPMKGAAQD